jgi:hypothetical protein
MIDRLVHHAEVISLKGDSYRLKDRNLGRVPAATADEPRRPKGSVFVFREGVSFRLPLTSRLLRRPTLR